MFNKLRKMMRNEKGFTLVELLAVIVILGIIAAIAVPSIGQIINNTKQDAHDANGITMIEASRLAHASGYKGTGTVDNDYTLEELVGGGFLESVPINPEDGNEYDPENSLVTVDMTATGADKFLVTLVDDAGDDVWTSSKNINDLQQ